MLYLIGIDRPGVQDKQTYRIFETTTESLLHLSSNYIKNLVLNDGYTIKNMIVTDDNIEVKNWPHRIYESNGYKEWYEAFGILLCMLSKNMYKIVDYNGFVKYIDEKTLKKYVRDKKIANCIARVGNDRMDFTAIDTYTTTRDTEFETSIAEEYKKFITKAAILGKQMDFTYTIEGREVRLEKYGGASKSVTLPKFVTVIGAGAFENCGIESITLNEGLKQIGANAFSKNRLSEIVIPQTLEIIWDKAFYYNTGMSKNGEIDLNKIKMQSYNTKLRPQNY